MHIFLFTKKSLTANTVSYTVTLFIIGVTREAEPFRRSINSSKSRITRIQIDLIDRQTAGISDIRVREVSQNMCIDHLIQCTILPWPKTAEKRDF